MFLPFITGPSACHRAPHLTSIRGLTRASQYPYRVFKILILAMGQELQKSHFPKVTRLTVDLVPCDWLRRSSSYYPVLPSQEGTSGRLWSLRHVERLSTVYAGHFKRSKRNVPSGAGRTRPRCPVVLAARKRLSLLTWEWQILVIGVLTVFVRRCFLKTPRLTGSDFSALPAPLLPRLARRWPSRFPVSRSVGERRRPCPPGASI